MGISNISTTTWSSKTMFLLFQCLIKLAKVNKNGVSGQKSGDKINVPHMLGICLLLLGKISLTIV